MISSLPWVRQMELSDLQGKWKELDPLQKQKRIAWSVATSTCIETREDPVMIYDRIMREYESMNKTNESQNSGNA